MNSTNKDTTSNESVKSRSRQNRREREGAWSKLAAPLSSGSTSGRSRSGPVEAPVTLPFFRRFHWLCASLTAAIVLAGYLYTAAPDLTLEDSGEMAVASAYLGVPHAPGYPVWTLYTWIFTKVLPFSNFAWRVTMASAVAGALACGLVALMVSRAASLVLDRSQRHGERPCTSETQSLLDPRLTKLLAALSGITAGCLLGFDGLLWSQSVIVEVYALSVLTLTGVMATLFRWMYVPHQRRYLYLAWFLFGLCVNNHQSLIVIVLAMEVCVALAQPKLGRDLLWGNAVCYLFGLYLMGQGSLSGLRNNAPLLTIYHLVGVGSLLSAAWLTAKTRGLGMELHRGIACAMACLGGLAFYLFMPLFSMSNPPMNWAYPRTASGFLHAITRGQYESVNPVGGLGTYVRQLGGMIEGVFSEFYFVYLLVALLPLLCWKKLPRTERKLVWGGLAFYLTLGPLLLVLLNPGSDRGSESIVRVFFSASHVLVAMAIGLGLVMAVPWLLERVIEFRRPLLIGFAVLVALALVQMVHTWQTTYAVPTRAAALLGLALTIALAAPTFSTRRWFARSAMIVLLALWPVHSVVSNWSGNEQRGHLFGFWFGHDLFSPPFLDDKGQLNSSRAARKEQQDKPGGALVYPEMAREAILFGGTDPGRFCPTYMIFCESFLPPEQRRDPEFDRRDVRIITQNALADRHYLEYIRAHYQRSAQPDPYFFSDLIGDTCGANRLGHLLLPLDRALAERGASSEARRRAQGVYPAKELQLPSDDDLQRCMQEYVHDLQGRAKRGQLKPGEEVRQVGNQMVFSGQATVMGINSILTREIFVKNSDHEFYVEESFPLDWMYPHLEPFGLIMKLNRQPLAELNGEVVQRDRHFWKSYMSRLMGDWVRPETNIADICQFAEQVHLRRDTRKYVGDDKFLRDEQAQKSFSKLRGSIGGVYDWRFRHATGQWQQIQAQLSQAGLTPEAVATFQDQQRRLAEEQQRMLVEAEFAYKQSYALCPYSPEAAQRLINLLASVGRLREALSLAETSLKLDPGNGFFRAVTDQIRRALPAA